MGNLLITFAILIVSLLLFHGALLYKPRPRAFWLSVDYFWFGTIALGLIGSTANVRQMMLSTDYDRQVQQVEYLHRMAHAEARDYSLYFGEIRPNKAKKRDIPRYEEAGEWFYQLAEALAAGYKADDWREWLREHGKVASDDPEDVVKTKKEAIDYLKDLDAQDKKLQELEEKASSGAMEKQIAVYLPWIVAVALALRLTRVTAEVLEAMGYIKRG